MTVDDATLGRHRGLPAGGGRRRFALGAGRTVIALLSVSLLFATGYAYSTYKTLGQTIQSVTIPALHGDNPGAAPVVPGLASAVNILIVGDDSRAGLSASEGQTLHTGGTDVGTTSTDALMIVHLPAGGKKATIVSLPRDSYVHIGHGYIDNKLNAPYVEAYVDERNAGGSVKQAEEAGANLLIGTIENLTGVTINRYVQVGFSGFEQIANVISTLPVNLCEAVDDHNSGFVSSAGKHTLNPVQMLEFVRQRDNLPGGDIAREKRQQYFLAEAFKRVFSAGVLANPSALTKLVDIIKKSFIIDGFGSLAQFADQMSSLTGGNISGQVIPTKQGPVVPRVGSVLLVDPAKVKTFVAGVFDDSAQPTSTPSQSPGASTATPSSATSSGSTSPKSGCIH